MSAHCKRLADLDTQSAATLRELANHHKALAAGAAAIAIIGADAETPNFSSSTLTSSARSSTDIFSTVSTSDLNFSGICTSDILCELLVLSY